MNIKERLMSVINSVSHVHEYEPSDFIFSSKYSLTEVDMVYLIIELSNEFKFCINDKFIDALELCTFGELERMLEQYDIVNS